MDRIKLISDLKRDEAFVPHCYQDSEGFDTIGYGRMIDKERGGGITEREAEYLLQNNIEDTIKELNDKLPWWRSLPEGPARALCNMAFNMGYPTLSGFRNMLMALENHDYEFAAQEALESKWARQVGDRAIRISDLIRSG